MIEKNGLGILIIDFGVMGEPAFAPDITRQEVAKAGRRDLATLASGPYKDEAMRVMAAGLVVVVRRLFDNGRLYGIIGMGGAWKRGGRPLDPLHALSHFTEMGEEICDGGGPHGEAARRPTPNAGWPRGI